VTSSHKISFDVDEETYFALRALIPHGAKRKMFNAVSEDFVRILSGEFREEFLGMVISGDVHIEDYMSILTKKQDKEKENEVSSQH